MVVGCALPCAADSIAVDYSAGITLNSDGKDFAPYYIASNRRGTVTQQHSGAARAALWHPRWTQHSACRGALALKRGLDTLRVSTTSATTLKAPL